MNELEAQLKALIISRYASLKKFCELIDMPWTTLDSILKRGVSNSNITNVLKITRALRIDAEKLVDGEIVFLETKLDVNKSSKSIQYSGPINWTHIFSGAEQSKKILSDIIEKELKEEELKELSKNINKKLKESGALQPQTLAAHFDGDEYTESELEEIKQFAEFVKNRKTKDVPK